MIHMKCQDLFSKKKINKKIYLKVSSVAVVIGALRVNEELEKIIPELL